MNSKENNKNNFTFRERLKSKINFEIAQLKKEIPVWEYIFWWILRVWMIVATIRDIPAHAGDGHYNLQMVANTIMMFLLPEFHILPRRKRVLGFFARLPYRAQSVALVMIFVTCVGGLHYNFYGDFHATDTIIHFIGGLVVVPVGYYIMVALGAKEMSPLLISSTGFGMSCFAAIFWEFFEFMFDNIRCMVTTDIADTQAWRETPSEFWQKYLPRIMEEDFRQRWGLLDTMTDLTLGLAGAITGAVIIRIVHERKKKKAIAENR